MKNRNIKYRLNIIISVLIMVLITVSCEKYLDKAPLATITDKDAFGTFESFQGWCEEMYMCVPDYSCTPTGGNGYGFQCIDNELANQPIIWDDGNYWSQGWLWAGGAVNPRNYTYGFHIIVWPSAWFAIRKANIGLSKLNLLSGTQEEKDLIKGQLLWFRGFMHFELMRWWGGLPYSDTVANLKGPFRQPRLNCRETALRAARDLKAASELLPLNWDNTVRGQATLGANLQRRTKIQALGFYAKALLYAASPLYNEESTGSSTFDADLCKQAAQAFADIIKICDETGRYKLQPWASYTDIFYSWSSTVMPGGVEVIMQPTVLNPGMVRWLLMRNYAPFSFGAGNNYPKVPTHNYTKNYAMANGLPINDPASGYNPNDPWTNREPRFYKDYFVDGERMCTSNSSGKDQYCQLYTNGYHRGGATGSVTGYFLKKWHPVGCNPWDNRWSSIQAYFPYMRLADIYLMYAEAVLWGYGTPQSSVPGSITAEQAVNLIRNRAQLPNIDSKFTGSRDVFWQELIRERAVELSFEEGFRFHDLRRWNLAGERKYLEKTAIDFDRGTDGKPINLNERLVVTRVYEKKHKWFPFQVSLTKLYPEFVQNPGW
jgi:starch-binding outer membrane protein, SusD/RagB family